jgi:hypothetical protein
MKSQASLFAATFSVCSLVALTLGVLISGCVTLPPDPVTATNYALVSSGMTKDQVFAILGPGTQQSESTMNGMVLENYIWTPRGNPGAQVLVMFRDGREVSKVRVGF